MLNKIKEIFKMNKERTYTKEEVIEIVMAFQDDLTTNFEAGEDVIDPEFYLEGNYISLNGGWLENKYDDEDVSAHIDRMIDLLDEEAKLK